MTTILGHSGLVTLLLGGQQNLGLMMTATVGMTPGKLCLGMVAICRLPLLLLLLRALAWLARRQRQQLKRITLVKEAKAKARVKAKELVMAAPYAEASGTGRTNVQ